jgi:hypothetical protein
MEATSATSYAWVRWKYLVILHPASRVDQNDIKIIISGISDRFLGDASRVLPVASFVELNPTFAPGRPVYAEHTQVSNVHAELFDCTAPARLIALQ